MKIAITGGTGFVGRTLARELTERGHSVALIARGVDHSDPAIRKLAGAEFHAVSLADVDQLAQVFAGCEAVVHCAGINRELGSVTYRKVHIEGTTNVVDAARAAGVNKVVLLSFLRARPDCGSGYHESKWAAEEIVRRSGLAYTIFKAGVIYGRGDHMLAHLSHAFHTFPIFGFVGFQDRPIRPVAIEDLVQLLRTAATGDKLAHKTVAVIGPEELTLREAVRRVAKVVGRKPLMFPLPVWIHYLLAALIERLMVVPMVSIAQIRMLHEGLAEATPPCARLPDELAPQRAFTEVQIRKGLPPAKPFGASDLVFCRRFQTGGQL